MIHKLVFNDGKIEFTQSKSIEHLMDSYAEAYPDEYLNVRKVTKVSEEEAKSIFLTNYQYDEEDKSEDALPEMISLFDLVAGDDFMVVGSTDID
jgi:hypothetical protein